MDIVILILLLALIVVAGIFGVLIYVRRFRAETRIREEQHPLQPSEVPITEDLAIREEIGESSQADDAEKRSVREGRDKRIRPIKRGGRPRKFGVRQKREKKNGATPKHHHLKPDIVCWKRGWVWNVGLEFSPDLQEDPGLKVMQGEITLSGDESFERYFSLISISESVAWQSSKDEIASHIEVAKEGEQWVLFKLVGEHPIKGRRVRRVTSGSFMVIVPDSWERDENVSGRTVVLPENSSIPGYQAHFFRFGKGDVGKPAFSTPSGNIMIERKESQFELVGERSVDADHDQGQVFLGGPPRIRASQRAYWENVGTIVIGVEGGGSRLFRVRAYETN